MRIGLSEDLPSAQIGRLSKTLQLANVEIQSFEMFQS